MKQPANEDWLILLRSTFAITQIMFTTVRVKVRPLLDLNAHLQTSCHLMQLQDDSCLIQDSLCLVMLPHISFVFLTNQEFNFAGIILLSIPKL